MDIEALQSLGQFTGTEQYYRIQNQLPYVMTDGVKFLAENAECFWLLDAIVSHQNSIKNNRMLQDFQVWNLKVNPDKSCVLTCVADSGMKPAITQKIEYTDFPLQEITLWVERTADHKGNTLFVVLLPSEH